VTENISSCISGRISRRKLRAIKGSFASCVDLKVGSWSAGLIPWPRRYRTGSIILCGDLVRAVKLESVEAVCFHWGVCRNVVQNWRQALHVTACRRRENAPGQLELAPEMTSLLAEADRLLSGLHRTARGESRWRLAELYLEFLLDPARPKNRGECVLLRRLLPEVADGYRKLGLHGAADFMRGRWLWLLGHERQALGAFMRAVARKQSASGAFWAQMLRWAVALAESTSKRDYKRLKKLAELEGVFSGQASQRTRAVEEARLVRQFVEEWRGALRKFPEAGMVRT